MIKINLLNDYSFDFKAKRIVKKISKTINQEEQIKAKLYISIIICNDEEIQKINNDYRHIDKSTDVISFALLDGPDGFNHEVLKKRETIEAGDIFISYDHILLQAKEYGHSMLREFAFLVTHGIHHILGYDHQNKEEEIIMFSKQEKILKRLGIER